MEDTDFVTPSDTKNAKKQKAKENCKLKKQYKDEFEILWNEKIQEFLLKAAEKYDAATSESHDHEEKKERALAKAKEHFIARKELYFQEFISAKKPEIETQHVCNDKKYTIPEKKIIPTKSDSLFDILNESDA